MMDLHTDTQILAYDVLPAYTLPTPVNSAHGKVTTTYRYEEEKVHIVSLGYLTLC